VQPDRTTSNIGQLTRRELQCLEGLAAGLSSVGIARSLDISVATVALHILNGRRKLGAKTREQAVAEAVRRELIKL
jgi:DNA-binding CsgD family transcriptional regulator